MPSHRAAHAARASGGLSHTARESGGLSHTARVSGGLSHATARACTAGSNPLKRVFAVTLGLWAAATGARAEPGLAWHAAAEPVPPEYAAPESAPGGDAAQLSPSTSIVREFVSALGAAGVWQWMVPEDTAHPDQDCTGMAAILGGARVAGADPANAQPLFLYLHKPSHASTGTERMLVHQLDADRVELVAGQVCAGSAPASQARRKELARVLNQPPGSAYAYYSSRNDRDSALQDFLQGTLPNGVLRGSFEQAFSMFVGRTAGQLVRRYPWSAEEIRERDWHPHLSDEGWRGQMGLLEAAQARPTMLLAGDKLLARHLGAADRDAMFAYFLGKGYAIAELPLNDALPLREENMTAIVPAGQQLTEALQAFASKQGHRVVVWLPQANFQGHPAAPAQQPAQQPAQPQPHDEPTSWPMLCLVGGTAGVALIGLVARNLPRRPRTRVAVPAIEKTPPRRPNAPRRRQVADEANDSLAGGAPGTAAYRTPDELKAQREARRVRHEERKAVQAREAAAQAPGPAHAQNDDDADTESSSDPEVDAEAERTPALHVELREFPTVDAMVRALNNVHAYIVRRRGGGSHLTAKHLPSGKTFRFTVKDLNEPHTRTDTCARLSHYLAFCENYNQEHPERVAASLRQRHPLASH